MRTATVDTDIGIVVVVSKGSNVILNLANANFNFNHFPNPYKFDITNVQVDNLKKHFFPFGMGVKGCVGQFVAMIEMRVVMSVLVKNLELRCVTPLNEIETHWDIAQQPVGEVKFRNLGMRYVFVCGASSSGKTTLVNAFLKRYSGWSTIAEIGRNLLKEMNISRDDLEGEVQKQFQRRILELQNEKENLLSSFSYISDRGIDNLVYSKIYCGDEYFQNLLETDSAMECIARYRSPQSRNFLLIPYEEYWKDDGVRMISTFEECLRFTEVMKWLFEYLKIPYCCIDQHSLDERLAQLERSLI